MENSRVLGLPHVFVCVLFVATTYTCLGLGNISVSVSVSVSVVCSKQERLALLKIKQSVKDPSGMLSSWVGNNCCLWERIICHRVTGNVEGVYLRGDMAYLFDPENDDGNYLVGNEVSSSLEELMHLKHLDLSGNDFQGSMIPEFIGTLKHLSYLNLSYADFKGIIPHHIGNLSNIKVLDLSSNLELIVDDMSWTLGLSSLEHLDLSSLDLSGTQNSDIVLYNIPSLEWLNLHSCGVSIPFLNSSRILPNIKHLDLGFNSFETFLPTILQNMTSLQFLDLSSFDLSFIGSLVTLLNMIPSLSELHLSSCGIDKTFLSTPHLNLSTFYDIQHLDLSDNSVEGTFPSLLTNMSSLRVLELSGNMLNSSVPNMPNLLELDLSSNEFKQIEHIGIWRLCHLKQLSASQNPFDIEIIDSLKNVSECSHYALERLFLQLSLNGSIPELLGRFTDLSGLHLSGNKLTGSIPESIRSLRFLQVLDLSENMLTGHIPKFLGTLSSLDLSSNLLNGRIPESIGELTDLTYLNLGSNQLMGPIPSSLGRLVSLQTISLSSNMLNGNIPVSFGQLLKLRSLVISNNFLEGVVSEAHFSDLSMLKKLDASSNRKLTFNVSHEWVPPFKLVSLRLSSCKIENGFPQWLRNQRELKTLVLSNASISGPLPTWLQKTPIIPYLDLSHNKLSGSLINLPNGGNFHASAYWALFLGNNLFYGSIPRSLCKTDLDFLDLSKNKLTGKIPNCFDNMQRLMTMIFSSNRLSGVIPNTIARNSLSLLRLSLNDNSFVGELPEELGNLGDLCILDLGDNEFSGNIPEWIGENLTSLIVLRLHNNNFTGRIPQSLCKASNLQILDVAYNNLTGTIPQCLGELKAMVNSSGVHSMIIPFDSDENVFQVMKGVDLEYTTTWDMVFNMDLSSNKLVGEIPVKLTQLAMLMGLNLSNNHLIGDIPHNIGNMKKLFSLDLSGNELIGVIPPSMAALNFLSHLNLSYNNLSGQIPKGNQLQTLNDPTIYAGNNYLCGAPLSRNCSNHKVPTILHNNNTKVWFYADVMSGFTTGFWGVIGVLFFKKQWRHNLFIFAKKTVEKIQVVTIAKMKREREA
ncbi:hypothetical protein Lser_V15G44332 [Lactuca serriola]